MLRINAFAAALCALSRVEQGPAVMSALLYLAEHESATVRDLAEYRGEDYDNAHAILYRCDQAKLAYHTIHRPAIWRLTEAGKEAAALFLKMANQVAGEQ